MYTPVAIALGSNLGDRRGHLEWASDQLAASLTDYRASRFIDTSPFQVDEPQPVYLNGVVVGKTALDPRALLDVLLDLERERGRERRSFRAARTLDLDLVFYGRQVIDEAGLVVPHPHFRERRFVLEPLAELAPDWRDPVTGRTVGELLGELGVAGVDRGPRR